MPVCLVGDPGSCIEGEWPQRRCEAILASGGTNNVNVVLTGRLLVLFASCKPSIVALTSPEPTYFMDSPCWLLYLTISRGVGVCCILDAGLVIT